MAGTRNRTGRERRLGANPFHRGVGNEQSLNRLLVKANPDSLHEKVVAALDSGAYVGIPEIELLTLD